VATRVTLFVPLYYLIFCLLFVDLAHPNPTHRQLTTGIPCDMANTSKLWFYIHGRPNVSSVSISLNETIDDLKKKIHTASPNSFAKCDAAELTLTKVRFIMVSSH